MRGQVNIAGAFETICDFAPSVKNLKVSALDFGFARFWSQHSAARGLDTANPILKLLAKAEMYSGIGTGFGTTLTGIVLSIVAAQYRSLLFGAWSEKIGRVYELVLDFKFEGFFSLVSDLRTRGTVLTGRSPTSSSFEKTGIDFFQLVGILVIVGVLFAIFLYFLKGYIPR